MNSLELEVYRWRQLVIKLTYDLEAAKTAKYRAEERLRKKEQGKEQEQRQGAIQPSDRQGLDEPDNPSLYRQFLHELKNRKKPKNPFKGKGRRDR